MTLAASSLDFGFRGHVVGRGLDATLAAGEVVCLLGPNGSGKSTLMRTLLGLQERLGGEVTLEGRDLGAWDAAERARHLAYVPQAADSYFDFSLREMVEMGRTAHRGVFASPGAQDREIAADALERLGIARLADRPIHAVSGGERQLALIARALATQARYLVMDEPTANLDYGNQARVLDEVLRLEARGHRGARLDAPPGARAFASPTACCCSPMAGSPRRAPRRPRSPRRRSPRSTAAAIEVLTVTLADGTTRRVCVPGARRLAPAAHVDDRAGGERRLVGQQPQDRWATSSGHAPPLHRHRRLHARDAPRLAAGGVDVGVDEPGPHRVHADALGRDLLGEPDRQRVHRALRRRVVDVLVGRAEARRAPEDTFTIAPPVPPCFVDMRRTASRAHRKAPTTLVANTRADARGVHVLHAHLLSRGCRRCSRAR